MKNKRNPMYLAIQSVLATGALLSAGTVFAQDDEDKVELERVVTTGTHIKATDLETAAPVFSIDREEIARTGLTNVGDLLRQIPSAGASLNLANNNGGDGSIEVDLRNLGSNRVLVMVNGKRWATSISGSADFTTIPVAVIERIDVLKDGASAVYGSDAIAGVINIITRTDYEGVEVSARYGKSSENDGAVQTYDISMGTASDRGSVFFNASYVKAEPVFAGDRDISRLPVFGTGNTLGSSGTPQGRFIIFDNDFNFINASTAPGSNGFQTPNDPDLIAWSDDARFNYAPDNFLQTPQERTSLYVQGKYQLTDNISVHSEALFNRRESAQFLAPEPLFLGLFGSATTSDGALIGIGANNPYNPYGVDLVPEYTAPGLLLLGRRMVEQGNRKFEQTNDTYYYSLGLEGYIDAGTGWDWQANYSFNQNTQLERQSGSFNTNRIAQALGNDCVAPCVPLNLFGGAGTITQDQLDYISFIAHNISRTKLLTYTGVVSSEIAELPAGPLGFAAGYEHRRQSGFTEPDALVVAGETTGNASQPTSGSYLVNEFFAEFNVPLLSDAPGAKLLDINAAARYSDYDNFGSSTTGKFGFRWKPFDDLLIRGTYSEAFRAPSIFELFLGARDSFPNLNDPCNGGAAANPTLPGCAGIPSNYQQPNPQIRITQGGNPNLTPEDAVSKTLGMVYEPSFVDGLVMTLDYYDIQLDNVVTSVGAQQILNACAQTGTTLCNLLDRGATGIVNDIRDTQINANKLTVKGFDFVTKYSLNTDYGLFAVTWDTSYTDQYVTSVLDQVTGQFVDINAFDIGIVSNQLFRVKSNLGVNWSYGDWNVYYQARYIAGTEQSCDPALNDSSPNGLFRPDGDPTVPAGFQWCTAASGDTVDADTGAILNDRRHVGGVTVHDIQAQYNLADYDTTFTLGIQNLFDKTPPLDANAFANSYNPFYYDGIGQRWYLSVSKRF